MHRQTTHCHGNLLGGFTITRRSTNLVFSIGLGQRVSQSMVMLLIPLWILQEHGSSFAIGVDVAAVSVAPMVLGIPIGAAADRLGSRRIVLIGSISAAIATLLSISIVNVWLFGFWQMIAGLGRSAAWIGAQASITKEKEDGNKRASRIGWLSLSAQMGNLGGPFLAGLLLSRASANLAFMVAAAAIAAVSFSISPGHETGSRAKHSETSTSKAQSSRNNFSRALTLVKLPTFRLVVIGSIVRLALVTTRNSFYVVFLDHLGWNPLEIGIILSLGSAASAGSAGLNGSVYSRFNAQRLLCASLLTMAAVFSLVPFSTSFVIQLIYMIVFGVGNGISQTTLIGLLAKATPAQDQGLAVGLRTTVNRAVMMTTPFLFGVLVSIVVLPTLMFSLGAASFVAMVGTTLFMRKTPEANADSVTETS